VAGSPLELHPNCAATDARRWRRQLRNNALRAFVALPAAVSTASDSRQE
jgi:hypothetical protein